MNLIRQGASGYLNKECDPIEIVNAIRASSLGPNPARSLPRADDARPAR